MRGHTTGILTIHLSCFVRILTILTEAKEVHDNVWGGADMPFVGYQGLFVVLSFHSIVEMNSRFLHTSVRVCPTLGRSLRVWKHVHIYPRKAG